MSNELNPPEDFIHIGQLYATSEGNSGSDVKVDRTVVLGIGAQIDTDYQQTSINAVAGGGAESPLTAGLIPPGFFITCSGNTGSGKRWAVLTPYSGNKILTADIDPKSLSVTQLKFTLGLYADTGNRFGSGLNGGSDCKVEVYYKPK